jgi:hypothetical protein
LLNVATPFTAFTVSVPLTPAGVELIVTDAEDPVTRFPLASSTCTTTGLSAVPAVPLDGGPVVNASLLAMPVPMEIELLVAPANPLAAADSVYVPDVLNTRLLNVATPFTAVTVSVPPTPAGLELIVTCADDPVTRFPLASSTCTTTELRGVPAGPLDGGSVVNASLLAAPAPIAIDPLVTAVNPLTEADSVYVPVVVNTRLLNVATPFTAFTVSVPPTPAGVELIVTDAVEPVTTFPFSSCNCTTTGFSNIPAVPVVVGCVVNASCGTYAR